MELSTLNSMGNPPDVDDVLCNLASPEIIRNKDDGNSTMTMAHAYNNDDPSFYSFRCTENNDDSEDVTEAKIKAFLEEKVLLCFWVVGPFIAFESFRFAC